MTKTPGETPVERRLREIAAYGATGVDLRLAPAERYTRVLAWVEEHIR